MRAVRFDRFGPVEVLTVVDVPLPPVESTGVLVRVKAAGINPGEVAIRRGDFAQQFPSSFPEGQGSDFAGVVTRTGADVRSVRVGDEVVGFTNERASHAEFVAVPAGQVTVKPPNLAWTVAGSIFVAGTTGWALVEAADIRPREVVLVSSAAGGTGGFASQIAQNAGAHVIALSGPRNLAWLTSLGLTALDYHHDDLSDRIQVAAEGNVDVLLDTHGDGYVELGLGLGIAPDRVLTVADFGATDLGARVVYHSTAARRDVLASLVAQVADGRLRTPVPTVFPLEQVQDAYRLLERGHTRGKIVLVP